jgi:hypothetical protein
MTWMEFLDSVSATIAVSCLDYYWMAKFYPTIRNIARRRIARRGRFALQQLARRRRSQARLGQLGYNRGVGRQSAGS